MSGIQFEQTGPCRGQIMLDGEGKVIRAEPLPPERAAYPFVVRRGLTILGISGCPYAGERESDVSCAAGNSEEIRSEALPVCKYIRMALTQAGKSNPEE